MKLARVDVVVPHDSSQGEQRQQQRQARKMLQQAQRRSRPRREAIVRGGKAQEGERERENTEQ